MTREQQRKAQARLLFYAVMNCAHADRAPFVEAILHGLRAGMPIAAFGQIMAEANFWADMASRAELKAYCAATFAHMTPEDQDAFRAFISQERAAA